MRKKTFLLISLSFILLSSCINVINSPKPLASPSPNIDTKISDIKTHSSSTANSPIPSTSPSSNININENNLPIASRSPEGQVEMLTPPPPDYSRTIEVDDNTSDEVTNQEKVNFDNKMPETVNNSDGMITVIYKNEYKMRVDQINHKIISRVSKEAEDAINVILNKYKILGYSDLSSPEQTEEEMDKMQSDYQKENNVDIPNLMSIHNYRFSKDVDILSLLKELNNTPYVRDAYSSFTISTSV